jgi:putative phosphoribosyl transferase
MDRALRIPVRRGSEIEGDLVIPPKAQGLVLFARGTGRERLVTGSRFVPEQLERAGFATLVLDSLARQEVRDTHLTRQPRIDVDLLTERVLRTSEWLNERDETRALGLHYLGMGTGSAAVMLAAARRPQRIASVVSLSGRPDLAGPALAQVRAPTLLIVGAEDREVLDLNRHAMAAMRNDPKLDVVPGAGPAFDEIGALERATELTRAFFLQHGHRHALQRNLH